MKRRTCFFTYLILMCGFVFTTNNLTGQTNWITVDSLQYTSQQEVLTIGNTIYSASLSNGMLVVRKKDLSGPLFYPIATDASLSYGVDFFRLVNLDGMPAVVFRDINGGVLVHRYNGTGFVSVGNFAFLPSVSAGFSVALDPLNNDIYLASTSYATNMNVDVYRFNGLNWTQLVTGFNPTISNLISPQIHIKTDRLYLAFRENEEVPTPLLVYTGLLSGLNNASLVAHPVSGQLQEITNFVMKGEANEMPFVVASNFYSTNGFSLSRLTAGGSQDLSVYPVSDFSEEVAVYVKNNQVEVHFAEYLSEMFYNYKSIRWNGLSWQSLSQNNIVSEDYVYGNTANVTLNENHGIASYIRDAMGYPWGYVSIANRKPQVIEAIQAPLCAGSQQASLFNSLKIQDLDFDKTVITWVESSDYSIISASTNMYVDTTLPHDSGQSIRQFEIFADYIGNAGTAVITLFITDGYEEIQYQIPVTVHNPPSISISTAEFETCANADLFDLNPLTLPYEGEFMYNGQLLPNGLFDPASYSPSPINVIQFIYTDGNGCTANHFIQPVLNYPSLVAVSTTSTPCASASGSAVLTIVEGAAPFTTYWSTGDRDVNTINDLHSGAYFVNVVDANNCLTVASANIEAEEVAIDINVTNVTCAGANTGAISVNLSGPDAPYALLWSTGHSSSTVTGLAAGSYDLWVRGNSGCETSRTVLVTENEQITVSSWNAVEPNCGSANGLLMPNLIGGVAPYTFAWSNSQTTASIAGLQAGAYGLTVTDQAGCAKNFNYALNNVNAQQLTARVTQPTCGNANGAIRVIPEMFSSVQSVTWSNGVSGFSNSALSNGGFTCELTDWAGCKTFRSWNLTGAKPLRNEICLLTVDSATTTNVIVWEKVQDSDLSHYNIYRETSVAGQYMLIDTVHATNLSVFNDVVASPLHRSWRYRISAVDLCGQEGPLSRQHKTIHLVTSQLNVNEVLVSWDEYEGIEYGTIDLYRHTDEEGWQLVGGLAITETFYVDTPPSSNGLDYMIEIVPDELCTAARAQDYNSSRSNKANGIFNPGEGTGDSNNSLDELDSYFSVHVFPNPTAGLLHVQSEEADGFDVTIISTSGAVIWSGALGEGMVIDLSGLDEGMYFLTFTSGLRSTTKKVLLMR
jgi:hypothetical protein